MDMSMTMEDFNKLLTLEKDDSSLIKALRQLTATEKLEDVIALVREVDPVAWSGPPPAQH